MYGLESIVVILALAVAHLFAGRLALVPARIRAPLLAAGGGASLAYVMLRLLPKLAEKQAAFSASGYAIGAGFLDYGVYLAALGGMMVYHLLSTESTLSKAAGNRPVFCRMPLNKVIPIAAHCAYSALIAYLVVNRVDLDLIYSSLIVISMGSLFLVSGYGFYLKDSHFYETWTRWLLCLSLVVGFVLGHSYQIASEYVALWYAVLAGIMTLSTITEKLKAGEQRSSLAFTTGAVFFAVLIVYLTKY